jgi:ABC-type branched-subunit amino acid transport system substrate-binding protein
MARHLIVSRRYSWAAHCGSDDRLGDRISKRGRPITLGFVTPLSAPGDVHSGETLRNTPQLWVDDVNKSGGIMGEKVVLAVFDDSGKPEVGASAVDAATSR